MENQEAGLFLCILSFVDSKKVWRRSGAQPRGLICIKQFKKELAGVARQQLHFLCVDKENGSKRKRPWNVQLAKVNRIGECPYFMKSIRRKQELGRQENIIVLRQLALSRQINFTPLGSA